MKKLFSCLTAFALTFGCLGSVQAAEYDGQNQFETNFVDFCTEVGCDTSNYGYSELLCHYDDNNEADWCLVSASCDVEPGISHAVFDDIIITESGSLYPFCLGLGVYDVSADEFYDICTAWDMDFAQLHEEFRAVMSDKNTAYSYGNVQLLGDVDKNGVLNIIDVTLIQRYIAGAVERDDALNLDYSTLKYGVNPSSLSDYNKDGSSNIADATAIQRMLAGFNG